MPVQASLRVEWDVDNESTRNKGSMTLEMRGTANLSEEMSVMDKAAPPGTIVTYSAEGVNAIFNYQETVTQKDPPKGCTPMLAEYHGSGSFQLEKINTAMTSGLNIRRMGNLVPKEMLSFMPPEAREMMIDYYDFFAGSRKQKAYGRRRGWNNCNFEDSEKEISPAQISIRFRITEEGEMAGNREWSVDANSGSPSFHIRVSDLPEKIERRPLVPEPDPGGDIIYAINWAFGEVGPVVRIERREGEFWVPLPEGEPVEVIAGERMELRGVVIPEEKDTKIGEWTLEGKADSGRKKFIKKFHASLNEGRVEEIDPQRDLKNPEIVFFWVDQGDGKATYKTTTDKKEIDATVEFTIKKPEVTFFTEADQCNNFGILNTGEKAPSGQCCTPILSPEEQKELSDWEYECKILEVELSRLNLNDEWERTVARKQILQDMIDKGCTPQGVQYCGICFRVERQDDIPGKFQYVQTIKTRTIEVDLNGSKSTDVIGGVLDGCYPYPTNYPPLDTFDAPGFSGRGENSHEIRTLDFEMYLMFKPEGEDNEWVPLKRVDWTWQGAIHCENDKCAEDGGLAIFPTSQSEIPDTSEYPEWHGCNLGQ